MANVQKGKRGKFKTGNFANEFSDADSQGQEESKCDPIMKTEGAGRRGSKRKPKVLVPTGEENESVLSEKMSEGEEYEEYDDEQDLETLIETLSGKLQFHIFNPDKYEIETHRNIIIVPPDHRKTSERMTEYEYTEVVSHRAKQIENGSPCFADVGNESDPIAMAEMEIKQKRCPLAVRRLHNQLIAEVWDINELERP